VRLTGLANQSGSAKARRSVFCQGSISITLRGETNSLRNTLRLFPLSNRNFLLAALLLSSLVVFTITKINSTAAAAQPQKTVVFAVSAESSLDAVVIVDGKQLRHPYTDEQKDAQKSFGEKYFAGGKVYRLIFGGGENGTVKLDKWSEGCNNIHAEVTTSTSAKLGGKVMALATNSETLGKRASSRRAPTDSERAAVLTLMKSIYRQRRTPASLIAEIKVSNLTATDLDGDGQVEFIGSFTLTTRGSSPTVREGSIKFERDLFLIAKPHGTAMIADFVKFQAYQPPPEQYLYSIDFVDQLDLDGDGVGEVFATQGGFDGYAYVIFKKVGGRWKDVYDQIGDAC